MAVNIRPLGPDDADAAMRLSAELGYPTDRESMLRRIQQIAGDANRTVLVGCLEGEVVGWIDLSIEYHLQTDLVVLIGGLVISEATRNRGIGRELCEAAEDWARGRGITRIRVRSNVIRERAHSFYLRDGYARVKTSAVFEKAL